MELSEAGEALYSLPPLSKKAFQKSPSLLHVSALEGRSVLYGMVTGYRMPLSCLVKRFPSAEAQLGGDSQAGSRILYKWGRGEAAPRRAHVFLKSGRRSLLDILEQDLPDVRCRVRHIVWAAADTHLTMHEKDAAIALKKLPEPLRALFCRAGYLTVSVKQQAVEAAVCAADSDLMKANLAAALLLWARSPPFQSFGYFSPETLLEAERIRRFTAPIIENFVRSSWIHPPDAALASAVFEHALRQPYLFERDKFDPMGTNPGINALQPLMGMHRLLTGSDPRRRAIYRGTSIMAER